MNTERKVAIDNNLAKSLNKPQSNSHWLIVFGLLAYTFSIVQNLNDVHMAYSFLELLIFFWLTQVYIFWSLFFTISHKYSEYCIWIQTPKETNHKIKTNIFTCFFHEMKISIFTWFFNIKLKFLMNNFCLFSVSWTHFQKQPFADVLQNRCS